jgi:hypothetical protein
MVCADERNDLRWVLASGGCWLIATIVIPFEIAVAAAILGGWVAARWIFSRHFPAQLAAYGLLAGLPAALFDLMILAMIGSDPVYAAWSAQNYLPLPHLLHLLSAYGLQLSLAVVGTIAAIRARLPHADLFVGWLVATPLLTLIPIAFQLRLIEGFAVPLTALAVMGLFALSKKWRPLVRRAAVAALLVLLLPSSVFLIVGSIAQPLFVFDSISLSADQYRLLEWARQNAAPGTVALSSSDTGLLLAAAAPVRVFVGHEFETPDFDRKRAEARSFYLGTMSDGERAAFLARHEIRYVWYGPSERAMACEIAECVGDPFDPLGLPLRVVASSGPNALYEVVEP